MTTEKTHTDSIQRITHLIRHSRTMTLATAADNAPWAAPVYYAALGPAFYFLSSPKARHIEAALASGIAAGAIYADDDSWRNLLGIQMSGRVSAVPAGVKASNAILAYIRKFPMVKTFFSGIKDIGLNDFSRQFNAGLYCFIPETIFFMDNSVSFGFRKEIKKDSLFQ